MRAQPAHAQKSIGRDGEGIKFVAPIDTGAIQFADLIGSRDPDHFHPGKRMDFLARLGEVLAVAIRNE